MDLFNMNLDVHYILTEYSMHIFICVIVGFGSLIYCLSIKSHDCVFESPKLSKKKPKKEKPTRSKIVKSVSPKIEIKEDVNFEVEHNTEIVEKVKIDLPEEDTSNWQPVVKPKRISKNEKATSKPSKQPAQNNNDCDKIQPVVSISKPKKEIPIIEAKSKSKPIVIESVCDKLEEESIETSKPVKNVVIEESKIEKENILDLHQDYTSFEEKRNVSESPTNSLSDDFEIVDVYKTSSEDGLKVEIDSVVEMAPSSTSGASRKKNKKQQKIISKQLIEAASLEDEQHQSDSVSEQLKPSSTSTKKKRPRKDI